MDINNLAASALAALSSPAPRTTPAAQGGTEGPQAPPPQPPAQSDLDAAIKEIHKAVGNTTTNLQFSVDEATGRTIVSVIDAKTREVVRQIPAEDVMKLARALDRMQGVFINGKA